jgi:hypothetical protein
VLRSGPRAPSASRSGERLHLESPPHRAIRGAEWWSVSGTRGSRPDPRYPLLAALAGESCGQACLIRFACDLSSADVRCGRFVARKVPRVIPCAPDRGNLDLSKAGTGQRDRPICRMHSRIISLHDYAGERDHFTARLTK